MKERLLYKRALITCVIMFFCSIILKLFGASWFDLNTDVPILMKIDEIVMNNYLLSVLYSWIFMFINFYLVTIICVKKHSGKELIVNTMVLSFICLGLKYCFMDKFTYILFLIDILFLFINCRISTDDFDLKEFLLVLLLNFLYQFFSLFIRSLGYQVSYYGLVNSVLLNLDYYIALIITYLYLMKGDETLWSIFHQSFSSLQKVLLKKRSEKCLNKEN